MFPFDFPRFWLILFFLLLLLLLHLSNYRDLSVLKSRDSLRASIPRVCMTPIQLHVRFRFSDQVHATNHEGENEIFIHASLLGYPYMSLLIIDCVHTFSLENYLPAKFFFHSIVLKTFRFPFLVFTRISPAFCIILFL